MVQTKLSMFIREETSVHGRENTFVTHEYIKHHAIIARPSFLPIFFHFIFLISYVFTWFIEAATNHHLRIIPLGFQPFLLLYTHRYDVSRYIETFSP